MKNRWAKRRALQELLVEATACSLQHTGWPCNPCFHEKLKLRDVSPVELHEMWQATLRIRGDYKNGDHGLDLPDAELEARVTTLIQKLNGSKPH